jgi:cysteinyl-tRNA synthetase
MALRLYSSLSRSVEEFVPLIPGQVRMYVCGMTTYDFCHIGHARAMMSFDLVYRWLRERGYAVTYVRNHTDVDDKIIARALEVGEDPLALSNRFVDYLNEDLDRAGILRPDVEPRVSTHIPEIIDMVSRLVARGHAYAVEGDVYFRVLSFPTYGQLSGKRLDDLRAGERVDVDSRKEHPGDFALWKGAKAGEVAWDSPWGPGRPGWHIECSAMASRHLGEGFDIHGGGIDLIFPHHENEIAQSECATGHTPFARYWLHNGHLNVGEKMSKSLGNVIRIRDILDQVPAEALRLLYFESHYRSPLPYSASRLTEALGAVDRIYTAREALEQMAAQPEGADAATLVKEIGEAASELYSQATSFDQRFGEAMDEDMNSARAVAALYELVRAANRFCANPKWKKRGAALARLALPAFDLAGRVLGIGGRPAADWFNEVRVLRLRAAGRQASEVEEALAAREAARAAKDWAAADVIRQQLADWGVLIMDGAQGTTWRMIISA